MSYHTDWLEDRSRRAREDAARRDRLYWAGREAGRSGRRPTMTAPFSPLDAEAFAAGFDDGRLIAGGPDTGCLSCGGELMPADDEFCSECRNGRA